LAWNSRQFCDNQYLLFVGVASLFIGGLDFLHMLAYKGMGVFPGYDANMPTQLWIAARYLGGITFFLAPFFLRRKLNAPLAFAAYFLATSLVLASIFSFKTCPICFVEGQGLTPFKKISEYIISLILVASIVLLVKNRKEFDKIVFQWVIFSIISAIFSELAFTFYVNVYGFSNLVGHFFKIISFYLLYKAIFETGLKNPYDLLFRNLKQSEDALRERTAQLEVANRKLEAPLRLLDDFSAALMAGQAERPDEPGWRYLERIQGTPQRVERLTSGLLNLSRVSLGDLTREQVDLSAMARQIAAELQAQDPKRQAEFTIAEGLTEEGDARLLRVALEHLMGNAWKFTATRSPARIEVGSTRRDGRRIYFVRDNGVGFDMAHADKLFTPFQRLPATDEFPGTGIGLATVQRILNRHGGSIWPEAAEGRSATFFFTLGSEHDGQNHSAG
jgi:signal transduction histidine kinase